jgi:integrase
MLEHHMALTETSINALKPKSTMYRVRDKGGDIELKGFGIAVAPSGHKSFFLSYTSPTTDKRSQISIGSYPGVSLKDARQRARGARALVREGIDPKEDAERSVQARKAAIRAHAKRGTVKELFSYHVKDLAKRQKTERTINNVESMYRAHIDWRLGSMCANEVSPQDILRVLRHVDKPFMRKEVYIRLKAAFKFGIIGENTVRWAEDELPIFDLDFNPVDKIEPPSLPKRKSKGRHLIEDEVRLLWIGDDKIHKHILAAVRLLLLTGLRIEEVLHAEWREFDTRRKVWEIPAERRKVEFDHVVPLTSAHLKILADVRKLKLSNTYLFPHRDGEKPRNNNSLYQALNRLRGRVGIAPFAPRDIRRTFKTLAGECGLSLEIRNRLQGHSLQDVSSRNYDKYSYLLEKREAIESWVEFLDEIVSDAKGGDNVVRLS